ncbi:F0F1 ATP synthase subunit epsilon [Oceanibium sediminis]|uniref:F0F1 ATP synthase subunit epsilon n=1 Tax=Oceanibium sediminis TaxID=2026339 RepID=UPI000DD2D445|nr:F0F1 ATP synthase subunit epsilon [Oceanibium sediminis]
MSAPLTLTISTPLEVIFHAEDIRSFRAEDESGAFGILPGHLPLLSVLRTSVVRWRSGAGGWSFCTLLGGVLTVARGGDIRIACREGVLGGDLARLEHGVQAELQRKEEAARAARSGQARLHARAVRQIMLHIAKDAGLTEESVLDGAFE